MDCYACGDDQGRHEQRPGMIVSVDVREEWPGVDDQSDEPNSAARISSIRSEEP